MKQILIAGLFSIICSVAPAQTQNTVADEKEKGSAFSVSTNLLYWLATVPNIGVEYTFSCGDAQGGAVGILLNGGWNHFVWKDEYAHDRTFFVQPEVRYYFPQHSISSKYGMFYAGVEGHVGQFNFKLSEDKDGTQGDFYGAGLTGGYRLTLNRTLDLDFSLGLGYTRLKYEKYFRNNGVFVLRESNLKKDAFFPTQVGLSLIWKL